VGDFLRFDTERAIYFRRVEAFSMTIVSDVRRAFSLLALLCGSLLAAQSLPLPPSDKHDGPDEAMMVPVTALSHYMAQVKGTRCLRFSRMTDWLSSKISRLTFLMARMRQNTGLPVIESMSSVLVN
jgi:hypothetical protein